MRRIKGDRKWHKALLPHPEISSWYNNMALKSQSTADETLRRLGRVVDEALGITPVQLIKMEQPQLEDAVTKCIGCLFKRGLLGSTVSGFDKTVRAFLKWHGREIKRDNAIPGADENPIAEAYTIPDQNALRAVLQVAEVRTRAMILVMAHGGQRPEVIGRIDASIGLRLKDLWDLRILQDDVEFVQMPCRVEVSKALSKNGKRFFFFLGPEACEYIRAYLRSRIKNGEALTPESPLFRPYGGAPRFMVRNNVGDSIKRAMRRAHVEGPPYIWRSYYANRCQLVESKGFLEAWRKFFMGHKGNIQTRYANRREGLPPDSLEAMRSAYRSASSFLESQPANTPEPRNDMMRLYLLSTGKTEEAIDAMDLESKTEAELVAILQEALVPKPETPKKPAQKIIPLGELGAALADGWLFKASLPNDKAVVEIAA